jgi:H+/Cl- antiporter ClcA
MTPGIPIFTEWWEMAVFILLGLIIACIGVIFSPILLTQKFIEYIRKT